MDKYPTLTAAEELDQWENLAKMDDCISDGRLVPADIRAMVCRLRTAETALRLITRTKVMGASDATSRAQIEALIDMAKLGLPIGGELARREVEKEIEAAEPVEIYQGPITPGMRFVCMPHNPGARCIIEVVKVVPENERHEAKIFTCIPGSVVDPVWNDESRFREACIPVDGTVAAN